MRYANIVALSVIALCLPLALVSAEHISLTMIWSVQTLAWITFIYTLLRSTSKNRTFLVRVALITLIPIALMCLTLDKVYSDDGYRYRWDGHVTVMGENPYRWAPSDEEVQHLGFREGATTYPDAVTYKKIKTVYPPGAQVIFASAALVSDSSGFGFKVAMWFFVVLGSAVFLRLCNHDQRVWCVVALTSPIYLLHGLVDLHTDVFMALLTGIAILLSQRGHRIAPGIVLGYAIAVKYLPILALPFLLKGRSTRMQIGIVVLLIFTIGAVYFPFLSSDVYGSLKLFALKWQANSGLYSLLILFFTDDVVRIIMACAGAIGVAATWWRHHSQPLMAFALNITIILLCSPVVHPWYLLLPVILLPFVPLRSTIVWVATMTLYGLALSKFKSDGVWIDHPVALVIEFLPVVAALFVDMQRGPLLLRDEHRADNVATS